ncbi:hypothetical protein, partial [Klebsiella pneumoniae]|uniref:hypothetical protein n=1 Tax=Klebsiella pneumoniae TaxID=573 RepID=UPI001D02E026
WQQNGSKPIRYAGIFSIIRLCKRLKQKQTIDLYSFSLGLIIAWSLVQTQQGPPNFSFKII